MRIYQAV